MNSRTPASRPSIRVVPATPEHWSLLENLFGPRGACGGCWCLWWRLPPKTWQAGKAGTNRTTFEALVCQSPIPPGVLAIHAEEAVGWCAVAPRGDYPRLARSRILAPVDDTPVWSVTCFFVAPRWRRRGLMVHLLEGAADLALRHGARFLEGYPVDLGNRTTAGTFLFTGAASAFRSAGFREIERRSPTRPIMRRDLDQAD